MSVTKLAAGVWRAGTRYVNWYAVDAGADGVTVIDAGLPGYRRDLEPSLAQMGLTPSNVKAVVLTHGHIDHTGMAAALARAGATVHLHPADLELAANPKTNKPESRSLRYLCYPGSLMFIAHAVPRLRNAEPMPAATPLVDNTQADVPGRPHVTHVGGHTEGSCVLEFRDHGVVFAGDLLCTVSPVSWRRAEPQLQTRASNRDSARAMAALDRIEQIESRLVLPGHGDPWADGVEAAVATARRIGCR